jgi:hypothetical protein
MIYKVEDIFLKLENCIKYRKPFSHIRFGDGGIKFIDAILTGKFEQMHTIIKKEGLPLGKIVEIFELWGYYARRADFIDTPEVYFNNTFWPRVKDANKSINEPTKIKMMEWESLYTNSEFDNENYCNPDSNHLMIIRRPGHRNLLDVMKGRKIALITARPEVGYLLENYSVDIIEIVGHYENQYQNSFHKVMDIIKHEVKNYDFWMIAAGELGRIYSGSIKENGGRTIDIGFIVEFWLDGDLHPRFERFLMNSNQNRFELLLTEEGKEYDNWI